MPELMINLHQNSFTKYPYEHAIYMKKNYQGEFLIICLYIDDLLYTRNSAMMFAEFKVAMFNEFEMTDNELMSYLILQYYIKQSIDICLSSEMGFPLPNHHSIIAPSHHNKFKCLTASYHATRKLLYWVHPSTLSQYRREGHFNNVIGTP